MSTSADDISREEFLSLYYVFTTANRRGGVDGIAAMLTMAHEIAKHFAGQTNLVGDA